MRASLLLFAALLAASEGLQLRPPLGARPIGCRRLAPPARPLRMSVSKQEMVDAIATKAGVSKKTAALVLASTLDVIVESVASGNKVSLIGFGTFDSKERPEREGRNPKTGEKQ